jgi:hypothetical protein
MQQKAVDKAVEEQRKKWEEDHALNEDIEVPTDEAIRANEFGEDTASSGYFGDAYHENPEDNFDIFEYCQKEHEDKGHSVEFFIKKNNEIMGELYGPCTWTMLQQKWGGGKYQVIAKDANTKQYIRSQTQRVGESLRPTNEPERIVIPQAPQSPPVDMTQMFSQMSQMFQSMQEMAHKEKAREERDEKKSYDSFNTAIMTVMQNQQTSTHDMFLKMSEISSKIAEKQSDNFSKLLEKMDDKQNKMFDKLADAQNKKQDIGPMELIKMMGDSRKEGQDTMQALYDLVEEKTASMEPGDSKESLLGTLVKGFAPLLTQATKSMPSGIPTQPRGPIQSPMPGTISNKQSLPQNPGVNSGPQRGAPPRAATQSSDPNFILDLPTFTDKSSNNTIIPETIENDFIEPQTEIKDVNREGNDLYQNATMAQKYIVEIAVPTIAEYIFEDKMSPNDVANIVSSELQAQGLSPDVVVKEFTFELLLRVAKEFGIEETKKEWLEEFYAKIQSIAGDGVKGDTEHTVS